MHGHVYDLLEKDADFIFLPSIINSKAKPDNPTRNYNCPWIQTLPYMVRATVNDTESEGKLLIPVLHFRYFGKVLNQEIAAFMMEKFGISKSTTVKAVKKADKVQTDFEQSIETRGREVLSNLPEDKEAVVILGRPYNTNDPDLNLRLVEKIINLDVMPIPIDFLSISEEYIFDDYSMMYWPNGRNILAAARIIGRHERLHAVYLGNFRCGPDSFLTHFVREELKGKPYLQLEVDEHSADAGMITRLEAFFDSLRSSKNLEKIKEISYRPGLSRSHFDVSRTLYIPYMCDKCGSTNVTCIKENVF